MPDVGAGKVITVQEFLDSLTARVNNDPDIGKLKLFVGQLPHDAETYDEGEDFLEPVVKNQNGVVDILFTSTNDEGNVADSAFSSSPVVRMNTMVLLLRAGQ